MRVPGPRTRRLVAVGWLGDPADRRAVLTAGWLFFVLLAGLTMLWPVREALGLARGVENLRRLFLVTVGVTLLLTPAFGWVASRVPRRRLLAVSLRLSSLVLLGFFAGLACLTEPWRQWVAGAYYVFHSVLSLFLVSLFWAVMADRFRWEASKRLFPIIALGGTLGALVGSSLAWQLAQRAGVSVLFPLAALFFELAVWVAAGCLRSRFDAHRESGETEPLGEAPLAGIRAVMGSSYLRGIGLFVGLVGVVSTFLYFTGLRLVAAASSSVEEQTVLFAHLTLWTQLATLGTQAFLATGVIRWAGVGAALAALPLLAMAGFAVLALAPTLGVFMVVNALFRAVQQGLTGPAQETLFTVLRRPEKYHAKSFLDTFGYRTGDAVGAQLERLLASLGPGLYPLAAAVAGLAMLWLAVGALLGRAQRRLGTATDRSATTQLRPTRGLECPDRL